MLDDDDWTCFLPPPFFRIFVLDFLCIVSVLAHARGGIIILYDISTFWERKRKRPPVYREKMLVFDILFSYSFETKKF